MIAIMIKINLERLFKIKSAHPALAFKLKCIAIQSQPPKKQD